MDQQSISEFFDPKLYHFSPLPIEKKLKVYVLVETIYPTKHNNQRILRPPIKSYGILYFSGYIQEQLWPTRN